MHTHILQIRRLVGLRDHMGEFTIEIIELTDVWKFSLRFQGPKLFNSLSTKLQNDSNIAVFISKLKSSFLVQVYFTCLSVLVCAFFAFFFCLPLLLRVCGFSFAELLFIILCAVDSIYILLLSLAWV